MYSAKSQDKTPMYKIHQLHFYTPTMNNLKMKFKKEFHLYTNSINNIKILGNKFN